MPENNDFRPDIYFKMEAEADLADDTHSNSIEHLEQPEASEPLEAEAGLADDTHSNSIEHLEQPEAREPERPRGRTKNGKKCSLTSNKRVTSIPGVERELTTTGVKRIRWSEKEEKALIAGLCKYKSLRWGAILKDRIFADDLRRRRGEDLQSKYKTLRRNNYYDFTAFDEACKNNLKRPRS